jgi:predicted RNA-binding protein with PIN domain
VLPPSVRTRAVALAAEALNAAAPDQIPASLRAVRRFTPAKQIRLGAGALALALETDDGFRTVVADHLKAALPDLVAALTGGAAPPSVAPVESAAVAYVLGLDTWPELADAARREAEAATAAGQAGELDRLRTELQRLRSTDREESTRLRTEVVEARAELDELRRKLRRMEAGAGRAAADLSAARRDAARVAAAAESAAAQAVKDAEAEQRRLRLRLSEAESALSSARRSTREARGADSVRLKVLLDTVLAATAGLRRELDLPLVVDRPADTVAGGTASGDPDPLAAVFAARGQERDAPALVDAVLAAPGLHLLVDGYNVTKTGYPEIPLESQRSRLLAGLGALAARFSGAELTCVFDGTAAASRPTAVPVPRGVRVLFSAVGELADELLVRLVRSEPPGRPVAVVTNDREIITAVHAAGARTVSSEALLGRLDRA